MRLEGSSQCCWVLEKKTSVDTDGRGTRQCDVAVSKRYAGATESLPKRVQNRVILFAEVIPIKSVLELIDKIKC